MSAFLILAFAVQATATSAPAKPAAASAVTSPDKPICRRIAETGSFVKVRKICMSREEWARSGEANRALARQVVSDGTGRASGE